MASLQTLFKIIILCYISMQLHSTAARAESEFSKPTVNYPEGWVEYERRRSHAIRYNSKKSQSLAIPKLSIGAPKCTEQRVSWIRKLSVKGHSSLMST